MFTQIYVSYLTNYSNSRVQIIISALRLAKLRLCYWPSVHGVWLAGCSRSVKKCRNEPTLMHLPNPTSLSPTRSKNFLSDQPNCLYACRPVSLQTLAIEYDKRLHNALYLYNSRRGYPGNLGKIRVKFTILWGLRVISIKESEFEQL